MTGRGESRSRFTPARSASWILSTTKIGCRFCIVHTRGPLNGERILAINNADKTGSAAEFGLILKRGWRAIYFVGWRSSSSPAPHSFMLTIAVNATRGQGPQISHAKPDIRQSAHCTVKECALHISPHTTGLLIGSPVEDGTDFLLRCCSGFHAALYILFRSVFIA